MRHCQGAARKSGMRARRASGAGEAVPYQRARARETPTVCPWRVPMDRADLSAAIIQGMEGSFEDTTERVAEAVGVTVSDEVVRRMTEGLGAVAEAEVQAAIVRVQRGQPAWSADAVVDPPPSGVLAVEVDGLYVQRDDGWHEMKVVTVAPLGPGVEVDPDTGRARLAWGRAS